MKREYVAALTGNGQKIGFLYMKTGFWLHNDEYFDCLANTKVGNVEHLLHGFCMPAAAALSERFGYKTVGAYTYSDEDEAEILLHAFCEDEHGNMIDGRGVCDDFGAFMEAFEDEFVTIHNVYVKPFDTSTWIGSEAFAKMLKLIDAYPGYYHCF